MNKIEFVDQTLRDAQQSLWGFTMRTDHMTPIAEMMDQSWVQSHRDRRKSGIYRAGAQSQRGSLGEDQGSFQADHKNPSSRVLPDRKSFLLRSEYAA